MIVIIPAVVALHSFAFMYLWNLLITDIFTLRFIDFWEALGLIAMAKLLFMTAFKGRGCGGRSNCNSQETDHDGSGFKDRMRDHFTSKYCYTKKDEEKIEE